MQSEADMNEFYAHPVAPDRVRVQAIAGGKRHSMDILVDGLGDELTHFESLVGHDAERMAVLRGAPKGSEIVMRAIQRFAAAGETSNVLIGVLWGLAHGPQGQGWAALDRLGGRIVMAAPMPGRGWHLEIADPAE
jgi:hypothetical protein